MNSYPRKSYAALALITGIALAATTSGFAQAQSSGTANTTDDQALKLEKFEVTGSYLPPAADSTANPVITVDNKAIENSGAPTNLLEVLRKTVPQFTGNGNLGSANANIGSGSTNGGSQLALRNTQTLVLIDGRRASNSPVAASGGNNFVDVNLIPIAAVDRIEVLADGASAIYGTDAVAGVVNIILKSDYQGFEIGSHYGYSPNTGHYEEKSGYLVGGTSNGKTNITMSAEWTQFTPIYQWQRPYSAIAYGTPTFAGSVTIGTDYYYLDPSQTTPTVTPGGQSPAALVAAGTYSGPRTASAQTTLFNLSQYVTQTIGSQRNSFTLSFDHQINDYLMAFGNFMYANSLTQSQINGQPINSSQSMLDLGTGATAGGALGVGGSRIPVGQFYNPFNVSVQARNRLVLHPRQYQDENTSIRGFFGLRGKIGETGWNWEAGAVWNRGREDYSNPGVINQKHLDGATANGDFNWFSRDPISDANLAADQIVGTATGNFVSLLENYDFKVTGKAFDLPGGPVDLAVGGEIRKEALTAGADPLSQIDPVTGALGWNGATTLYPFDSSRTVKSVFAEVRIPIAKDLPGAHLLEASAAVRHEEYSDTSNPTVPKFSIRYLPFNDEFAVRASYSKSFSAPSLFNLFGPNSIGFTNAFDLTAYHPALFPPDGIYHDYQSNGETGSNPNLKPSNAKNYSFGVVWSPKKIGSVDTKGFSISLDYWHIKQTDLISSIGAANILQDVELNGANSIYIDKVSFGSFGSPNHPTAPGQISEGVPDDVYVTDTLVNIASQELSGIDAVIKYTYNADSVGRFDFTSNIGYYESYKVTFLPGEQAEQDAGNSSFSNGTIPRWLAYSSVEYSRGKYGAYIGWRHIPGVHDIADDTHTSDFDSFDVSASYTCGSEVKWLSGAKITVGCTNVFNKFGPLDPTIFTDSNVDTSTYGAVGRMLYVDLKYKF
jgi:iron complex outermembrane receptor protein